MLFLPAAALCCLCSALAAMATQLSQDDLTVTRTARQSVSFSCGGTGQCGGSYVYWYQKKEGETFRIILRIKRSDGSVEKPYNHPQQDDFSASNTQNRCELIINKVKLSHSASYFCSCLKSGSTVRNDPCCLNKNLQINSSVVCSSSFLLENT
ncbi:hypothetical protein AMECASPLE_025828 [Ameca splendens]|uniref:Ig-like domain-containing protein n=1 Tax=Ameca splendens TaxID=208324 RepID=A0ABV0XTW4_9TELE